MEMLDKRMKELLKLQEQEDDAQLQENENKALRL